MKKYSIILLSMLAATGVWAQDTLSDVRTENYFYNALPDYKQVVNPDFAPISGAKCGIVAKEYRLPSKTPVKVYGVAASMVTIYDMVRDIPEDYASPEAWEEWWNTVLTIYRDTSLDYAFEYLGLYLRDADSLAVQQEKMVHKKYDQPAYYVRSNMTTQGIENFVYPMYEKYFDSAITVQDTFYMGTTQYSLDPWSVHDHVGLSLLSLTGMGVRDIHEYFVYKSCFPNEEGWVWPPRLPMGHDYRMIFPILTPEPDDPGEEPGDTTGVTAADLVSRYVTVQPNPATEEARVLSSFGIEGVEVFDAEGRRVAELRGEGLEARIDVRGWAAGSYLLRVATPLGATTKKLLVR